MIGVVGMVYEMVMGMVKELRMSMAMTMTMAMAMGVGVGMEMVLTPWEAYRRTTTRMKANVV